MYAGRRCEGETILFPCYQAKTDANQTKQKTPLVGQNLETRDYLPPTLGSVT